ncbi:thioredoxin family protein [Streptosporangium sp. NPDC005286]|uniref:thioredoxin family protein n=1 Tax=Streptosporangium sp. NPDC005286 TaxID=3154463 RepID=UPI0033A8ED77
MMELTVLVVPDCPSASVLDERLAEVLADRRWVSVMRRVIDDDEQAARWGMRGSPTLLIDGVDPFADPGVPASVSCRMYRDEDGRLEGAPSVAALRRALGQA